VSGKGLLQTITFSIIKNHRLEQWSRVPLSKWDTWFGGSRWWLCGPA